MDIQYQEFGRIVVEGITYDHDVVIDGGRIAKRDKTPSRSERSRYGHTPLTAGERLPTGGTKLIIGTGYSGRLPIAATVVRQAEASGIEVIQMPTADAARLIQSLGPADVNAVLHVTC